jgi:NAD(P)-dependent dehydrogenase (short-subunit alcohol dehydrogenase family)
VVAFDRNIETKFEAKNVVSVEGSVTSEDDVLKALDACEKEFGRLDAVVNCAGIAFANHSLSHLCLIIITAIVSQRHRNRAQDIRLPEESGASFGRV